MSHVHKRNAAEVLPNSLLGNEAIEPAAPEPIDPAVNTDRQLDPLGSSTLRFGSFVSVRMTDSSDHPRQILLEAVASDIAIGHCDAALTPSIIADVIQSIPSLVNEEILDLVDTLIRLLPSGYVQQLTDLDANKLRVYPSGQVVTSGDEW